MSFQPDPEQRRVLDHASGPLLVTGWFGTGKTGALQDRFARLIEGDADPERVALVVRSRRERERLRSQLVRRLDRPLPSLRVMTLHGLAYQIVGERFEVLGDREPPQVLSAADQLTKVQELLRGEEPSRWPAYGSLLSMRGFADQIRQFLNRAQEAMRSPEEIEAVAERAGLTGWLELARFYRLYLDVLEDLHLVDFAGLVREAARAAEADGPAFEHVLVDDHQDSTMGGESLIAAMRPESLVVAGNLEAHVFSFQGTTDAPLRRLLAELPARARVELTTRYRGEDLQVGAWRAVHSTEEHAAVARELRRIHLEEDVPYENLAVIVRRQSGHVPALLRALDDAGVPRDVPERGLSLGSQPGTWPYALALRWIARPEDRDRLVETVLTSELGGLSPAGARGLLRAARTTGVAPAEALSMTEGLGPAEIAELEQLRATLADAEARATNVLYAFEALWRGLSYSARLVAGAEGSATGRADLDAVLALADAAARAGSSADPSVNGFVEALDAGEGGPGLVGVEPRGAGVSVLTAHGAAGREFDTVIVVGAVEGDFPSLTRPEPMFDLASLEGIRTRSERNRERLEDERRLFRLVLGRARRRVLLTASEPHDVHEPESARSRFVDELGIEWRPAPSGPFEEPVSVAEAAAAWRQRLADPSLPPVERLASLDGLLALGVEPERWWFLHDWTDTGRPLHEHLTLSYSRLSTLENCALQFVLGDELGLSGRGGYQAGVGKIVHDLIERCEAGEIERTEEALAAALEARWDPSAFPSLAVSELYKRLTLDRILPNWWEAYGSSPAIATEVRFEIPFDDATLIGAIDRIGPHADGATRITDFKTGRADRAEKPADSLQLGIYYLAVTLDPALEVFRPVRSVELAYLRGDDKDGTMPALAWPVSPAGEEDYQGAVRERVSELIDRVRELDAAGTYRPDPDADCYFCDFKTLCPLYPEGRPLFATEGSTS